MEGLKILGTIDLSQFSERDRGRGFGSRNEEGNSREIKNPEKYFSFLKKEMLAISQRVNEECGGEIIDESGSLIMEGSDSNFHKDIVEAKEQAWAGENGLSLADWRKKRESNASNIAEMAVVSLLDKFFGDRFLVVRASSYDDYEYGVDNILVDKETGAVICGFDQVIGMGKDDGSSKKREKMEKALLRGGTKLEYGISLDENKKIRRKKLTNIPAFFLAITKEDLSLLLSGLSSGENTESVIRILNNVLTSIKEQYYSAKILLDKNKDDVRFQALFSNLEKFKESFKIIEEKVKKLA
jgi:hypothetical protein